MSVGQREEKGTGGVKNGENLVNVPQAQGRERGLRENGREPEELTVGEIGRSQEARTVSCPVMRPDGRSRAETSELQL